MTDHISINVTRLTEVLDEMRGEGISTTLTTDIIERYMGGFHSNQGVPAADSWNAQFGKYLKANSRELGISEVEAKIKVIINGRPTSASRWNIAAHG